MYKNYVCPTCKSTVAYPAAAAPVLQPACATKGCFGRMVYESTTAYPPAPPPPPVMTAKEIEKATRTLVFACDGTFCEYRLEQDRKNWKISFAGKNKGSGKEYKLELDAGEKDYELPAWNGGDKTKTNEIFVKNAKGETNWEPGPTRLPKVVGPKPQNKLLSVGHEALLLGNPIRVQIGSQNENNQNSGSGLIHLMFSHDRESLQSVQDLVHGMLFPLTKIKAVYKTKAPEFGHYRFCVVGAGANPHVLVLEGREGYLRLITLYKLTGPPIATYNKFKKSGDYTTLYSADTGTY